MSDDPYVYPGTDVLINKFDIREPSALEETEREFVAQRLTQAIPAGDFDLEHVQAIHHHLFQDVYDWAGEVRTVEISKDGHQFQFRQFIETGMADVHRRIVEAEYFRETTPEEFAAGAGQIIGDVNYAHPFREGNGRTQLQYLKQLGAQAGHEIDLERLNPDSWIEASREAHQANYDAMTRCVGETLVQEQERLNDNDQIRAQMLRDLQQEQEAVAPDREQDAGDRDR